MLNHCSVRGLFTPSALAVFISRSVSDRDIHSRSCSYVETILCNLWARETGNYHVYCAATKRHAGEADYRLTTKWITIKYGVWLTFVLCVWHSISYLCFQSSLLAIAADLSNWHRPLGVWVRSLHCHLLHAICCVSVNKLLIKKPRAVVCPHINATRIELNKTTCEKNWDNRDGIF